MIFNHQQSTRIWTSFFPD